jgi:UDP-N-acetylmuramoyl-tripeptide--D-alanyl-D-alanine ligase
MEIQNIHKLFLETNSICIDTRKIKANSMFVAIKGENFDANTFAKHALELGAKYAIIDNPDFYIDDRTILVKNSLETLQKLATFHRNFLNIPIIALTGSNGKTTTKELIHVVLQKKYRTTATIGNLNNHIGVPLTLLSFTKQTEIGIVEMGANHQKEIEFLCQITLPDYGFITNFGKAHLEGFGGVEGVIKGKSEMYVHLRENHKIAFINLDDAMQIEKSREIELVGFGQQNKNAFLEIESVEANPFVIVKFNKTTIKSNLIGLYNANNINVAITIGKYFGISSNDIKSAIEGYVPENNRSQLLIKNGHDIILDAYNANPSSMKVAIENFVQLEKPNKVIFFGDMFEMGNESEAEHFAIVNQLEETAQNIKCFLIGKDFYKQKNNNPNFYFFENFDQLASSLKSYDLVQATILIKGSRGMALERIVDFL